MLACGGIGAILAAFLLASVDSRDGTSRSCTRPGFGSLALVGFGLAGAVWQLQVISLLEGLLFTGGMVVWGTLLQTLVPTEILGRVTSLDWFVSTSLVPVSFALTGPVSAGLGVQTTLVVAGLLAAGVTFIFLLVPGVRDTESDDSLEEVRERDRRLGGPSPRRDPEDEQRGDNAQGSAREPEDGRIRRVRGRAHDGRQHEREPEGQPPRPLVAAAEVRRREVGDVGLRDRHGGDLPTVQITTVSEQRHVGRPRRESEADAEQEADGDHGPPCVATGDGRQRQFQEYDNQSVQRDEGAERGEGESLVDHVQRQRALLLEVDKRAEQRGHEEEQKGRSRIARMSSPGCSSARVERVPWGRRSRRQPEDRRGHGLAHEEQEEGSLRQQTRGCRPGGEAQVDGEAVERVAGEAALGRMRSARSASAAGR